MRLLLKLYLLIRVFALRMRGHDISVGKGSVIHPSVSLWINGGRIRIGTDCEILKGTILATFGGTIDIGNKVGINPYCVIYGHGGTSIGDNVRIASGVKIIPAEHVFTDRDRPIRQQGLTAKGIKIEDDVWIGTGAIILDGSVLSAHSIVGAGSVMKGNTLPYEIFAGVPARKIKDRP